LAAGINIPDELPYQGKTPNLVRKASTRLASNMTPKIERKMSEPSNQMKVKYHLRIFQQLLYQILG
jgi:hypothetical protein